MIYAMVFVRDLGFPVLRVKLAVLRLFCRFEVDDRRTQARSAGRSEMAASPESFAQVGEWLKPTDCKSVPPSEVRRFESFPVHQS